VKIEYLADHAGAIPTLAQWHHDQWHTITPRLTVADRIAGFRSRMRRLDVPTGFVAVLDEVVVGMACLVAHDMETRPELTPWLATVLVAPEYRGRGIGSARADGIPRASRDDNDPRAERLTESGNHET
jgi:GNAT superfamily N-acetyltransferase